MWLDFFILPILLFLDSQIRFAALGLPWPLQSSFIFLFFVFVKRDQKMSLCVAVYCLCLAKVFSVIDFWPLFVSYALVWGAVYFVKKRIVVETFLFEALWSSVLFFAFLCVQFALTGWAGFAGFFARKSTQMGMYVLLHFAIAFFALIVLDRLYGRAFAKRRLMS